MSKFLKTCLIGTSICIPVGILLMIIGFFGGAKSGFYISSKGLSIAESKKFTYTKLDYSGIKNLDIDIDNAKIIFNQSTNGMIGIDINLSSTMTDPEITSDHNTLSVKSVQDRRWRINIFNFDFSFLDKNANTITVYVPASYKFADIKLDSSNGTIEVRDMDTDSLNLDTSNGPILIENVKVNGKVSVKTSNGRITFDDVEVSGRTEAKTSNGVIDCNGSFEGPVDLKTSNGKMMLSGIYEEGIYAKTSNGRIDFMTSEKEESYNIDADTSNGQVIVDGTKMDDEYNKYRNKAYTLEFKSSNGSIALDFNQ